MRKAVRIALGVGAACMVACAVVHRRVIAAVLKGEEIPEPPAWHKGHPGLK